MSCPNCDTPHDQHCSKHHPPHCPIILHECDAPNDAPNLAVVECSEWLKFIDHELQKGSIKVFPLSDVELRKLVEGWRAIDGFEIGELQKKLNAIGRLAP